MKKTFWGYSIQEVDETVGYLETQNIKLERQVKQLSSELDKAKRELEEARVDFEASRGTEGDAVATELRAKLEIAESKNRELAAQNEALNGQLGELLSTAGANDPLENVGNVCKQAYADIYASKQKAKESLEGFLSEFFNEWNKYELKLAQLSEEIVSNRQKSRESFISYADYILKVYGVMEQSDDSFETKLSDVLESRANIERSLGAMLAELDGGVAPEDNAAPEVEVEPETEVKAEPKLSILDAIRKLKEDKAEDEPAPEPELKSEPEAAEPISENRDILHTAHLAPSAAPTSDEGGVNISQRVNIRNII